VNRLACRVMVAVAGRGSHSLIGVYAAVRCGRNPKALPSRLMRQFTGPEGNPQFRLDRKIRTFRLDITEDRLLVSLRPPHVTFPANAGSSRRMFHTRGNST
jgi:hypothetical protein